MSTVKLIRWDGMRPAWDDRLLENNQAAYSRDAFLYAGTLTGWRAPKPLFTLLGGSSKFAYRIPVSLSATKITDPSYWVEFNDPDTNVIRSPTANDTFQRYYFANPSQAPKYNTTARIAAGNTGVNQPFLLGVPASACPPVVTAIGGGADPLTAVQEARSYVYTWVTAYGEESAPSPYSLVNAFTDSVWQIGLTTPSASDMGMGGAPTRNIVATNIYRTVVDTGGNGTFFFVAQVPVSTAVFTDTVDDSVVALNNVLPSATWGPPPSDLQGFVSMPNGMMAGFRANEIWFCEPYLPHSWPSAYVLTTEYPIVGLGVTGSSLAVCTTNYPVILTGLIPGSMSELRTQVSFPCISRASIVNADAGVFYQSQSGLILVQGSGQVINFTEGWITRDKWATDTPQSGLRAINFLASYFAIANTNSVSGLPGFTIDFGSANYAQRWLGFNYLSAPGGVTVDNVMVDPWTGTPLIIQGGKVLYYDFADQTPTVLPYRWKSKVFQQTWRQNLEVMRMYFDIPPNTPTQSQVRVVDNMIPALLPGMYGIVRVWAGDDVNDMSVVTTREIRSSGELLRILSGFKVEYWQWEFEGIVTITSMQAATSVKELREM